MTAEGARAERPELARTLLASAALGFVFGWLYPATQVAIEPAQLLTGLVAYPPGNPFGLYESRAWTALHQILALPLLAGVGERTLSQLVSGGVGALNFAAIATCARALGAPAIWAVAAPFLLWAMNPVGWGYGYPILLVGHPHTYGTVGLAWVVLGCSLICAGRHAAGAAMLGFAPAVHASVGASMAALTGLCVGIGWRSLRPHFARLAAGGALGAALAGASLALHLWMQPPAPPADAAAVERLFPVFMAQWDAHRQPLEFTDWRAWLLGLAVAIAGVRLRRERAAGPALLLRVLVASAGFGLLFALVRQHGPTDAIPRFVLSAMPTRILNFPVIAFVPLVIAVLAARTASPPARGAAVALVAVALLWPFAHPLVRWGMPLLGVAALVECARRSRSVAADAVAPRPGRGVRLDRVVATIVSLAVVQVLWVGVRSHPRRATAILRDRSTDPALAAAARGSGLLAVAPGLERVQLATRRPIVLDPQAIDMVTYVPAALPEMARAIEALYGLDFENLPPEHRHRAIVPVAPVQAIWQGRTVEAWQAAAAATGAQEVLVPATWQLAIPEVARSRALALHRVPEAGAPAAHP